MTSRIHHRPPAFDGKAGYQPKYQGLSSIEESYLIECLSEEFGHVERMDSVYEFPCGFYRTGKQSGQWDTFFKILPISFQNVELFASSVESFLLNSGVAARDVTCQPFTFQSQDFFYCKMPFVTFAPMQGALDEAEALGQYLKSVHGCLQALPEKERVKANWLKHKKSYEEVLSLAFDQGNDSESYPFVGKAHLTLLQDSVGLLDFDVENAQVVHGDLNPGNILFNIKSFGSMPIPFMIIDYEISLSSYFPREFDVAMLAQRLFLEQYPFEYAIELTGCFLKGYGPLKYDLIDAMKAMPIRSLLILLGRIVNNQSVERAEWMKFVDLYRFIDENETGIRSGLDLNKK